MSNDLNEKVLADFMFDRLRGDKKLRNVSDTVLLFWVKYYIKQIGTTKAVFDDIIIVDKIDGDTGTKIINRIQRNGYALVAVPKIKLSIISKILSLFR